ncbi:ParA family protein [Thermodesulfovibrio hydrogeniphilus]
MIKIITFANKKGGSGKTTTVVNLAATLAAKNKRVLLLDLDPQCHATFISGINPYAKNSGG